MKDSKLTYIKVSDILPSPSQPRRHFDPYELEKLAESIKTSGIIQPQTFEAVSNAKKHLRQPLLFLPSCTIRILFSP